MTRFGLAITVAVSAVAASTKLALADNLCPPDTLPFAPLAPELAGTDPTQFPIELEADQVSRDTDGTIVLTGRAEVKQGRKSIAGDELRYTEATDEVEAKGNVVLRSPGGDRLSTDYLRTTVETVIGYTGPAQYEMVNRSAAERHPGTVEIKGRGDADRINLEGQDILRLENGRYTTCAKGQDDFYVVADDLTLDNSTGVGYAKNVQLRFMDTPIYYAPRMTFPINDERKSGFLTPSFGSEGDSGFTLATPYYWNMAPNRDATFTPKYMADRGLMLEGEFRYLDPSYDGIVRGAYLPGDRVYEGDDDNRGAFTYLHNHRFSDRLTGEVNFQWASDSQYFDDFSNELGLSGRTHLPQRVVLNYFGNNYRFSGRLDGYQTIDDTISKSSRPHERLPKLNFSTFLPYKPGSFRYGFDAELVNFEHDTRVTGTRLDLTPSIAYPIEKVYGFVTPKVSVRHTSYFGLDNIPAGYDSNPSRTVGIFSLDSGLFFERDTSWLDIPFIQTLEPRAYYVYSNRVDQNDLPVFDTGVLDLNNFGSFFRDNRFTGADRVEDANRVTLAVTSRMLEAKSGREWMRASLGQIFYFDDREVTLFGTSPETDSTSDTVAEAKARLTDDWSTIAFLQWNNDDNEVRQSRLDVVYNPDAARRIALGYRYTRDSTEQIDLIGNWPLAKRWSLYGRYLYSLRDDELREAFAHVQYDACCWKVRVGAQRRVDYTTDFRNAVVLEFELTGLTTIRTKY